MAVSDRKPFAFFVATPDTVVNVWPNTKEERDEWMVAIKNVARSPFGDVVERIYIPRDGIFSIITTMSSS